MPEIDETDEKKERLVKYSPARNVALLGTIGGLFLGGVLGFGIRSTMQSDRIVDIQQGNYSGKNHNSNDVAITTQSGEIESWLYKPEVEIVDGKMDYLSGAFLPSKTNIIHKWERAEDLKERELESLVDKQRNERIELLEKYILIDERIENPAGGRE